MSPDPTADLLRKVGAEALATEATGAGVVHDNCAAHAIPDFVQPGHHDQPPMAHRSIAMQAATASYCSGKRPKDEDCDAGNRTSNHHQLEDTAGSSGGDIR